MVEYKHKRKTKYKIVIIKDMKCRNIVNGGTDMLVTITVTLVLAVLVTTKLQAVYNSRLDKVNPNMNIRVTEVELIKYNFLCGSSGWPDTL